MHKTIIFVWIVLILSGLGVLAQYQSAPGPNATIPAAWPSDLALNRDPSRHSLILFAHPQCPCTRASIGELARLMTKSLDRVDAKVVIAFLKAGTPEWDQNETRRRAAEIPGVSVVADSDGAVSSRFGIETSGHVVLFDPQGRLTFQGGITPSRGHFGDNAGSTAIGALISGEKSPCRSTPVFGCPLRDS